MYGVLTSPVPNQHDWCQAPMTVKVQVIPPFVRASSIDSDLCVSVCSQAVVHKPAQLSVDD